MILVAAAKTWHTELPEQSEGSLGRQVEGPVVLAPKLFKMCPVSVGVWGATETTKYCTSLEGPLYAVEGLLWDQLKTVSHFETI